MPKFDVPVTSPSVAVPVVEKQWVTVPDEDAFEFLHPDIEINGNKYGPGKHFVSAELAGEIDSRVKIFAKGQVRLIRNGQDKAVRARMNHAAQANGGKVASDDTDFS